MKSLAVAVRTLRVRILAMSHAPRARRYPNSA